MVPTRAFILAAVGFGCAAACNALLDNEPRHLGRHEVVGGEGGLGGSPSRDLGGEGGVSPLAGNGPADAGAAGAPAPSGGEGGAATCECSLPHATSRCRDGACEIAACQAGFVDANSMPGDGCETGDLPSAGLLFWFMADRGLTYTGDQVSAWADQSSAHVTASASGAAAMPKRVVQASGPPMVEFDGADDGLKMPDGFASFTGTTFFAVAQAYAADGCAGIVSLSNGDDADDIEYGRHTGGILYYEVLGDFVEGTKNAFEPNKRLLVSITQTNTGAAELRINGALTGSPTTISLPAAVVRTQNFLGRDTYTECPLAYKGLLGEVVLYSRGVNASEYARIQAYLAAKWGIQVVAP